MTNKISANLGYPDYLFFSANNIMHLSGGSKYKLVDDCDGLTDAVIVDSLNFGRT